MTKEEIVRQEYEKYFSVQKYDGSVNRQMNFEYFSAAMDEWAQQMSIGFGKWIAEETVEHYADGVWLWRTKRSHEIYATEDLYKLFLSQIK
jgi:hypothetical protein